MGSSPREHEADGEYECTDQQTNQTSLDVNELFFLYMVAKLLSTCAKVLHYNKEITKSATKRIR